MNATGKFSIRLALYALVATYLAADVFIFKGPLRQKIDLADPHSEAGIAHAKSKGVVARVAGRSLTHRQLERATAERLWLEGKTLEATAPADLGTVRQAALDDLIFHELIREQVEETTSPIPVGDEEINERLRRMLGRFETKGAMESAMKDQGIPDEKSLRDRLAASIRQEKWIAARIAPAIRVTEEEAKQWFEQHPEELAVPERIEARHVFIPSLGRSPDEARQKLEAALAQLSAKTKDFPTLARELSEDPATRDQGGAMGWMTRDRLPADFAAPVFSMALNQPALVRTRLGWHLVEVTARKAAESRTFEQALPEISSAMEVVKRTQAIAGLRSTLRKNATAGVEIIGKPDS